MSGCRGHLRNLRLGPQVNQDVQRHGHWGWAKGGGGGEEGGIISFPLLLASLLVSPSSSSPPLPDPYLPPLPSQGD